MSRVRLRKVLRRRRLRSSWTLSGWHFNLALRLAADTTYGNGEFLQWLADRDIAPYMRTRDSIHRKGKWLVMSIRIYG
jgi:hypothetical protein